MSDSPEIPDPLARYRLAPARVRAGLSAMYNDIERAPDEQGLSAALNDALLLVSRMLHTGKVSSDDAKDLDDLFIVTKERRALFLADDKP